MLICHLRKINIILSYYLFLWKLKIYKNVWDNIYKRGDKFIYVNWFYRFIRITSVFFEDTK